jgi:hypothetical protein
MHSFLQMYRTIRTTDHKPASASSYGTYDDLLAFAGRHAVEQQREENQLVFTQCLTPCV